MEKRNSSFELLRILAMCMIITLHYLTKAIPVSKLSVDSSVANHLWWLLYAFCMVATNVYVLISGYFLAGVDIAREGYVKHYLGKLFRLVCEVFFYSWIVPLVMGAFGLIELGTLDFGDKLSILMPLQYEHYWFATAYVAMYVLSPVLVLAIQKLGRDTLKAVIGLMILIFSVLKSVNPFLIPWDRYGCDFYWFICLFLIAGYIRRFEIKIFKNKTVALFTYIALAIAEFAECAVVAMLVRSTDKFEYFMDMTYSYNHILVLASSLALFYVFADLSFESRIVNRIAPCTFGIYLLHENLFIRFNWFNWLGIERVQGRLIQILHLILCVIVIFTAGMVVDYIRQGIFKCFMGWKTKK